MSDPFEFPDLDINDEEAETILETDDVAHIPVHIDFGGQSGMGEGGEDIIDFTRQALTLIAHGANNNTNPWHGPNVWTITVTNEGVLVTSLNNPGPTPA